MKLSIGSRMISQFDSFLNGSSAGSLDPDLLGSVFYAEQTRSSETKKRIDSLMARGLVEGIPHRAVRRQKAK